MKICAICDKIQRFPEFKGQMGDNFVILCEEHKESTQEEIRERLLPKLGGKEGVESWDYLWQGRGRT